LGIRGPFSLEVRNGRHRKAITVSGVTESDLIRSWEQLYPDDSELRKPQSANFRVLPGGSVALMRVSHWDDPDEHPENDLRAKFAEYFSILDANKTKTLIIDIRHNGGGEETLGTLLLSYLAKEPFRYYKAVLANGPDFDFFRYAEGHEERDALPRYVAPLKVALSESLPGKPTAPYELVNRPNLGLQQPSKPHFDGQVLILIDGGSFSTSAEFAAVCHSLRRATFIGEESSGAYYGDDSGITPTLVLPNTKLRIDVPLIAYYMAVDGRRNQNRGVLPDCFVKYTIQDELEGRDKGMELALKVAAGEKLTSCKRIDY
jgi:C-terminal processing protease CtpA/Prc